MSKTERVNESASSTSLPMPLLDIATAKLSFQTQIFTPSARSLLHNRGIFVNDKRIAYGWNIFHVPKKEKKFHLAHIEAQKRMLMVRAVVTLERKHSVQIDVAKSGQRYQQSNLDKELQYVGDESEELDSKEKLRRMRISKANSGKMPWNKGRKHSEETKKRIKERTKIAMQNPKVKMKLINLGHAQSEETRTKIGLAVRTMWGKRRERLNAQETCHFQWQNLIAEASRRGFSNHEELQWNSYETLDEELENEWLESVEQRKQMPRPKGNKRAPKSLEQRRRIAEAIAAKWADPAYRDKVCSALSKYHGSPVRAERQPPGKRPSGESQQQPRAPRPTKKKVKIADTKSMKTVKGTEKHLTKFRRRNAPLYKDPLASSKLEMIKSIRAQRSAAETSKTRAIEQAKLLIAEAEKAAKALETAALKSPLAYASLLETRNIIAEAIQSLESIENMHTYSQENDQTPAHNSVINGTHSLELNGSVVEDLGFGTFNFRELVNNGEKEDPLMGSSINGLLDIKKESSKPSINGHIVPRPELEKKIKGISFMDQLFHLEPNGKSGHEREVLPNGVRFVSKKEETPPKSNTITKKWICGRLVEVAEGERVD